MSFCTSPHSVRYNFVFLNSVFLESYIKPIIYMKNYLPLYIILVWIFSPIYCFSQDPSFSQFYNAKSYLNPATIGIEEGLSIAANSRLQWLAIDRGFLSNYVSFEKREPLLIKYGALGVGASFFSTTEGFSGYSRIGGTLTLNTIFGGEKTNISAGFNARWLQEQAQSGRFIFSDQLDPIFGNVNSSSFSPDYIIPRSLTDFDFGFLVRQKLLKSVRSEAIYSPMLAFGASINNVLGFTRAAHNSFLVSNLSGIKPRLCIHGGMEIPVEVLSGVNNNFTILPIAKLESQGNNPLDFQKSLVSISWGSYIVIRTLYVGAFFQSRSLIPDAKNTSSIVAAIGTSIPLAKISKFEFSGHKLFIGLSMDVNATSLGSSTGNSFEFAMRYNFSEAGDWFSKKKGSSNRKKSKLHNCYHFI